jgi:trehalose 6-phosphate synthase
MSPRLIIVSNRVVAPEEADSSLADELAATVKAALKNQIGMWFGWSGKMADQPGSELRTLEVNKVTYVQIDLSNTDIQEYCNGLANSVLWPILHYRVDLQEYSRCASTTCLRIT